MWFYGGWAEHKFYREFYVYETVKWFSTYKRSHCSLNCVAKRFDEEKVNQTLLYNSARYFHKLSRADGEMPESYQVPSHLTVVKEGILKELHIFWYLKP